MEPILVPSVRQPASSRLSRRSFARYCAAGAGALALPLGYVQAEAAALPADRSFAIFRKGVEIGRHDVSFSAADGGILVTTEIDIAIKVLLVTAYRYEQSAVDRWVDDRLVASTSRTNDNGERCETSIHASGAGLTVEGGIANRAVEVPLGTMTDIAFWNDEIVHQQALINTQKVELSKVASRFSGEEAIEVAGSQLAARRYTMTAGKNRSGDIWFDAAGNWIKGTMTTRGETLDYRLIA